MPPRSEYGGMRLPWRPRSRRRRVETTATSREPGEYVVRVFANDRSGGGGSQCCWTNAFVRVTVSS